MRNYEKVHQKLKKWIKFCENIEKMWQKLRFSCKSWQWRNLRRHGKIWEVWHKLWESMTLVEEMWQNIRKGGKSWKSTAENCVKESVPKVEKVF